LQTKGLLQDLQKPITGPCPEPVAPNQHPHPSSVTRVLIVFSDRNFMCIFLSDSYWLNRSNNPTPLQRKLYSCCCRRRNHHRRLIYVKVGGVFL
jgi:hypothetical protein